MRRGNIVIIVLAIVALVVLIIGSIMPFILLGTYLGGNMDKPTGVGSFGQGCFVSDAAFIDTSVIARRSEIITEITNKWPNAKKNEQYINQVFDRAAKEGVNPLIPLSIWLGEQTFDNPEKAFGYGYTDSGIIDGVTGWEQQLNGVYSRTRKVLDGSAPYDKPISTNRFTRLFFNYTTAMRYVYENSGNSWDEEGEYKDGSKPVKVRLSLFRLVASEQIECVQKTMVAGARTGNDGVPLYKQADFKQSYGSSTIAASGCCPVSATMVMNFFGVDVDVVTVANISASNGFYIAGQGTNHAGLFPFLAKRYDLKFEDLGTNWNKVIAKLKEGKPVIARGEGAEPYTQSGHCIVLTGYDEKTKQFRVNNSARGDGPYALEEIKRLTTVVYYLGR